MTEERLIAILATIDNVVWSISADTHETLYLNPAAEKVYGRPVIAFHKDPGLFLNIVHPEDRERVAQMLLDLVEKGPTTIQYRIVRPNGEVRWLEDKVAVARGPDGRPVRFDGVAHDITERKTHEAQLQYLATHDALTDLPNRNLLSDRITQAIAHVKRSGQAFGVVLLDLDRFNLINDSYGHAFGDALLLALASRLRSAVREGDTVARLGGDEFIVLLTPLDSPGKAIPAVRRLLNIFSTPFSVQNTELYSASSIGIAIYPTDGTDPETLLKNADAAMYRAKELGRNGFQFFTPEMSADAIKRLEFENAMRRALERGEFTIHYQPQVDVKTRQVTGVEALLRWQHPTLGILLPDSFIKIAEETGLIVPIGAWVLKTACAQNKAWQDAGLAHLHIGINISAKQFWEGQILHTVKRILTETGLPPDDLELEITEAVFLRDVEEAVRMISELKFMGIAVSMDNFGTGYSSFNYLRRLPIERLKIDGSFIRDLATVPNAAILLKQIIQLAHAINLRVVAEGVETKHELAFLANSKCDMAQGFYLHKPLSSTEFRQLLEREKLP